MKLFAVFTLFCAFSFVPSGWSQYPPGQYPPGRYPPGAGQQGPLGGSGIPVPWGKKKGKNTQQENKAPNFTADGQTVTNDGKQLVIATNDGRWITSSLTNKTKWVKSGADIAASTVAPRSMVHLEAAEDGEANLTAVEVELVKEASAAAENGPRPTITTARAETPSASKTPDSDENTVPDPTALGKAPDDPDRPILRRGKPKKAEDDAASNDDEALASSKIATRRPASQPSPAAPPPKKESSDFVIDSAEERPKAKTGADGLIARSTAWAATFSQGLPNFVCQQMTTRYMQETKNSGWQALDVLSAKVVYENGKEDYRDIMVGGKRTGKSMLELGGSTSTGEFASTLQSLFSPASHAQFKFFRSTTVASAAATIYDFTVALPNSDWTIRVGGQTLRPAYSGSVWIDRTTAEVRRIEMQADRIPKDFPLDSMEWAVDYDSVSLGTAKFLLPVRAENLSCQRGSSICSKNEVEFRDYHKYTGESTITFK